MSLANGRWGRIVLAAMRLAGLYVLGVLALVFAVGIPLDGLPSLSELGAFVIPSIIVFSLAFTVLAVARRAGFVLLWLIMIGIWIWMLNMAFGFARLTIPLRFISWTMLAFPLFTLGALGVPTTQRVRIFRWRLPPGLLVFAVWVAFVVAAVRYSTLNGLIPISGSLGFIHGNAPFIWGPVPFLIAGFELVRVWIGLGRMVEAR